jgi:diguanylate cyclase (GGDEF)-like protein
VSSGPAAGGGTAGRPGAVDGRDVDGLLQAVVAEVGAALGFWSVDLWTFSEDVDSLVCRAWWCRDEDAPGAGSCVGAVVGLDQSHDLRRLVLAGEVVERHAGDDLSPADAAALAQAGFTSRIDVPLLAGAEVLGVLSLAEKGAVRRLSTEDRERLGSLARLAAAVLRAARLYESEADRAGRLVALLASGRGVSAALSVPEIVAAVRDEAAGMILGVACKAEIVLRRDDGTYALPNLSAPADTGGESQPVRADAVARQAVERGRPESGRTPGGRARLVAPLLAAGQALGYIELTADLQRQFRSAEVELATLLAGQTAAALERARSLRALQSRSAIDTVSGLYSRWYFFERLYAEVARARRYREPLALVVAELDREDGLAAARGAEFRDAALAAVARLVLSSLRDKVDVACRLGAGRFALLLPSTPPGPSAAGLVAERIRVRVAGTHLSDDEVGELGRFTMSLGVAGYPDAAEDADELMAAAESRLAAALAAGGDRVEPPLPDPEEQEDDEAPEGEPA